MVKDALTTSARAGFGEPHPGFHWLTYAQTLKLNRGDELFLHLRAARSSQWEPAAHIYNRPIVDLLGISIR